MAPDASPATIVLRILALWRGSPLTTPTSVSPARPDAGVQARDASASSALTHHTPAASASRATAELTPASLAYAPTSQEPAQSPAT